MTIPKDSSGAVAALPASLIDSETGEGVEAHVWNDVGGGLTDQWKVRLPGGAYGDATIARIVEIGGGDYEYQLADTETAAEGVVAWYLNVADHDIDRRWDRIVEAGGAGAGAIHSGTAQSATATGIRLANTASSQNGRYVNATVVITGGAGAGQLSTITGYVGATRDAQVADAWTTEPDATSTYDILPGGSPRAAALATLEGVELEAGYTLGDLIRGLVAMVMGEAADFEAASVEFKGIDGVTTRVTVTYDDAGRANVAINTLAA